MPIKTRPSNKNAHPGMPDVEVKQKRRSSQQVQAMREEKQAERVAKEEKSHVDCKRIAELEEQLRRLQEEHTRTANHSLEQPTPASAMSTNTKSGKGKGKGVRKSKKTPVVEAELTVGGDTDIDIPDNVISKPIKGKKRAVVGRVTREDIEKTKQDIATKALQVLAQAGAFPFEGNAASKVDTSSGGRAGKRKTASDDTERYVE